MENGINANNNSVSGFVQSDSFSKLNPNTQEIAIDGIHKDKKQDAGTIGRFLGTNTKNAALHSGLIICVNLLIILLTGFLSTYKNNESICRTLLETIVPIISLSIGYIFGKGDDQ